MKINIEAFKNRYYDNTKNKLIDNWQEGIRLLPFTSNTTSAVDRSAGIEGPTGLFFRIIGDEAVTTIEDFKETERIVETFLTEQRKMNKNQVITFINIMRDILFLDTTLNISDTAFLKYIPLVPYDENLPSKTRDKFKSGQTKLANLLCSLWDKQKIGSIQDSNNIFTKLLKDALSNSNKGWGEKAKITEEYFPLSYVKNSFNSDLNWLISRNHNVITRYVHLFLHFYICYELLQVVSKLRYDKRNTNEIELFYFILQSESASVSHDAVKCWKNKMPKKQLDEILGRSQALDILNSVLDGPIGFYQEIMQCLNKTPFEENKVACETLLSMYQKDKRKVLNNRSSEKISIEEIDTSVKSYEEFLRKMEYLCAGLQSPSYVSRMRKKFIDVLSIRFLQLRRGNYVLSLDNEMLLFLIAMVTKSKRVKLDDMYHRFRDYGIVFNLGTRNAIEMYLLKLNLLDRKSDSGETQYVQVIL